MSNTKSGILILNVSGNHTPLANGTRLATLDARTDDADDCPLSGLTEYR